MDPYFDSKVAQTVSSLRTGFFLFQSFGIYLALTTIPGTEWVLSMYLLSK